MSPYKSIFLNVFSDPQSLFSQTPENKGSNQIFLEVFSYEEKMK